MTVDADGGEATCWRPAEPSTRWSFAAPDSQPVLKRTTSGARVPSEIAHDQLSKRSSSASSSTVFGAPRSANGALRALAARTGCPAHLCRQLPTFARRPQPSAKMRQPCYDVRRQRSNPAGRPSKICPLRPSLSSLRQTRRNRWRPFESRRSRRSSCQLPTETRRSQWTQKTCRQTCSPQPQRLLPSARALQRASFAICRTASWREPRGLENRR